jgi:plastocyanin
MRRKKAIMKTRSYQSTVRFAPIALAVGAMLGMGVIATAAQAAEPTKKIEIVAKDKEWKVSGHTLKDEPTEIVVRNEDTVTHGFNSSLFKDVTVKVEGDGYLAKGKGPNVYRVDPGKAMILHFNKPSTGMGEGSVTYAFWCDMHPHMKGEMFVLSVRGDAGG